MRKLHYLILFLSLTLSAQKIDQDYIYNYSEEIQFEVQRISKSKIIDIGIGNSIILVAKKGQRFVTVFFDFENMTSENQIIDFNQIFIKDSQSNLFKIEKFFVTGIHSTSSTMQQKIKRKKKRRIMVHFKPINKNEEIKTLVVNGKEIELLFLEE